MSFGLQANEHTHINIIPLISINQMCERLSISRSTLYRRIKAKKIASPIRRNQRILGWRSEQFQ
jgi:excisionase family DNA binding protein